MVYCITMGSNFMDFQSSYIYGDIICTENLISDSYIA